MQVGHAEFKAKALVENIVASVQKVVENVPGGKENLKSIHVKSTNSPAILVYWSEGNWVTSSIVLAFVKSLFLQPLLFIFVCNFDFYLGDLELS